MLRLSFYGATQEVTGSCFLLEDEKDKILIDCGLFQCPKFCDEKSMAPLPFDPHSINAVFVTHAHIDHTGRLPKLFKDGFSGPIYSTLPTRDLAELMLKDSVSVLAKEHKESPYDETIVDDIMKLWVGKNYHENIQINNFSISLYKAGHILGSSMILVGHKGKQILFTGDLGNSNNPLLFGPEKTNDIDYLVMESTYGDRMHEDSAERKLKLERAIERRVLRGGVLMIPTFSLERTQEILLELTSLLKNKQVPKMPIFVDSPLAIKATRVYEKYASFLDRASSAGESGFLNSPLVQFTETAEESKHINNVPPPKIIMAGSGMSTGGRILHHELRYFPDSKNTILFIGYQAPGSLGRIVQDGADEATIFGQRLPVRCYRESIDGYSAHPDKDGLYLFVQERSEKLKKVFMIHGEPKSLLAFAQQVRDNLGIEASAPKYGETVDL